jgi:cell division protein ZapA
VVSETLVSVRILGREYSLRAGDNPERVRRVAAYLDTKLREISKASPNLPASDVAILGALNIVDDYLNARGGETPGTNVPNKDLESIHDRIRRIIDLIPD